MNPTIKKLTKSVQLIVCAAYQINSYTKAVEELVFNSLDSDATSIAVRIYIAEGSIQVVDNGCGILQADLKLIGQNYVTSKLADISILESAPNKYGFQGQSLANLIQVSESLQVTSRSFKCETTYVKKFENGKAKSIVECSSRPSKGTTIDIRGFLYNLNIHKRSVNRINELQNIKTFLEHVSLLHTNVSISLRDDSKNEIVFKIHKNRDMYQTLSTLYDIDKSEVQELQVEKNKYTVKAYIGKRETEETKRMIFLNGKIVTDPSPLHKEVNEHFKKYLTAGKKVIKKNGKMEDETLFGNCIPFYCLFITCPYMDYQLTSTVLEFKDWGQIYMLLEKLVKFSNGDNLQLKPAEKYQVFQTNRTKENNGNHIEEIMQKILGNHCKKTDITQMQKGVKGKLINRKTHYKKRCTKDFGFKSNKPSNNTEENSISETKLTKSHFQKPNNNKITKKTKTTTYTTSKILTKHISKQKKNKVKIIQRKKLRSNNKISLSNMFAMQTESVKKRFDYTLALQTKKLINKHSDILFNENSQFASNNEIRDSKNITIHKKVNDVFIHEYKGIPLRSKINDGKVAKDKEQINTNYDLLQTILSTQQEGNKQKESVPAPNIMAIESTKSNHLMVNRDELSRDNESHKVAAIITVNDRNHVPLIREHNNLNLNTSDIMKKSNNFYLNSVTENESINLKKLIHKNNHYFSHSFEKNTSECSLKGAGRSFNPSIKGYNDTLQSENYRLRQNTHLKDTESSEKSVLSVKSLTDITNVRKDIDNDSPFEAITYQSHSYNNQDLRPQPQYNYIRKRKNFITTQSKDNFTLHNIFSNNRILGRRRYKNMFSFFRSKIGKNKKIKSSKMFDLEKNTVKGVSESYTIEFTETNENLYSAHFPNRNEILREHLTNTENTMTQTINNNHHHISEPLMNPILVISKNNSKENNSTDCIAINENTVTDHNMPRKKIICETSDQSTEIMKIDKTYTVESPDILFYGNEISDDSNSNTNVKTKLIFLSKSQEQEDDIPINNPIDVCEVVLNSNELSMDRISEFDTSFNQRPDSCTNILNGTIENVNKLNVKQNKLMNNRDYLQTDKCTEQVISTGIQIVENHNAVEVSCHFAKDNNNTLFNPVTTNLTLEDCEKSLTDQNKDTLVDKNASAGAFIIKNRLCFVPKGLSPIFKEHQIMTGDHDPNQEYYEDNIYNNFAHRVKTNAEMLMPRVQETNDLTTKDISKVNTKLNEHNASLKFDGFSIRNANVLGQVDNKFIAAIMEGRCHKTDHVQKYLVLFDQHAVHERYRLESNLADYLIGSQWKSVPIDKIILKISRDDILYLHNYREKFTQFGLEWTILTYNEISVTAIPEGILGKNLRHVDKIMKAVKNLIKEEINIIQTQSGCVSLYPKSIMDLVFSEACRYAIKFGDQLSKSQCSELLKELSTCKSPFQCAHGRPAMAVIMNIERKKHDFQINMDMLQKFKNK